MWPLENLPRGGCEVPGLTECFAPMSTESEPSPSKGPTGPSQPAPGARKKKKGKKAKVARPLTEQEINAPDRQTLWMLGSLSLLGVTLWVFAHAGCNYHPPRETRRPRTVTTADLTRDPKDAAIELQQRLLTFDYKGALEISGSALTQRVAQEKSACEANRAACDARKEKVRDAISMGIVLAREPMSAKVRVITHRIPDGPKKYLALVERDGGAWKVTAHVPDRPGAELPAPSLGSAMRAPPMPTSAAVSPPGAPAGPAKK